MTYRLPLTLALTIGLALAGCSENAAAPEAETDAATEAGQEPAGADDDSLEPEAPKVEEGEEHNEAAPHSH